jgi:CheY-like chemotaxis protein
MDTTAATSTSSSTLTDISKRRSKILIVDDEPDISYTLKNVLEQQQQLVQENTGYEVTVFNDPVIALSNFQAGLYDLLLLDIRMPNMNGFELHYKIQKIDDKVKVCYISAYELDYIRLRETFPSLKTDCLIKKPVDIDDLVKRVKAELA